MNISAHSNSKISFTSKIKFVTSKEFEKLPLTAMQKAGEYVAEPWTTDQVILKTKGYTDMIASCTAGGVQNLKNLVMFHFTPDMSEKNLEKIREKLTGEIAKLQKDNKPLNGLLIGGSAFNGPSIFIFEGLKKILEDLKVNLSIIWGQTQGGTRVFYSSKDDTWVINSLKSIFPEQDVKSLEDLIDNFSFIHIADGDELFINNKKDK